VVNVYTYSRYSSLPGASCVIAVLSHPPTHKISEGYNCLRLAAQNTPHSSACPSVVHLSFSNGATYSIYNDTVFLLSYVFTGYELQVEERSIDLSGVVWTNCTSVKDLFQHNADLAAFDAQWRNNYW
jgi:hypothetical protein